MSMSVIEEYHNVRKVFQAIHPELWKLFIHRAQEHNKKSWNEIKDSIKEDIALYINSPIHTNIPARILASYFHWGDTLEGWDFWRNIDETINALYKVRNEIHPVIDKLVTGK